MLSRFATFVGTLTCSHHWVRARWEDGSYGLRCEYCFKRHPQTWNQILAQPASPPAASRPVAERTAPTTSVAPDPAPRAA